MAQRRRQADLGVRLVECQRALADLPDRLLAFLPGLILGLRYANPAPEGNHSGRNLRSGCTLPGSLCCNTGLDLTRSGNFFLVRQFHRLFLEVENQETN